MDQSFNLRQELKHFGANDAAILLLDFARPDLIEYLDLLPNQRVLAESKPLWLDAVVETQKRPLLYVVRDDKLSRKSSKEEIAKLRQDLACRGDGTYVAVISPGQINVYPVGLTKELPEPLTIIDSQTNAGMFIQDLANGLHQSNMDRVRERAVHELLFDLLNQVTDELLETTVFSSKNENSKDEVLSLVGRALFTRFLIDRGILTSHTFHELNNQLEECFGNAESAIKTCEWLDQKFNGELLPLANKEYSNYFHSIELRCPKIFKILSAILYRAKNHQLSFDLYWNDINFAHVPVGLLSEVYEKFSHKHFGIHADLESIHYTPRIIAEYMLDQALPGIKTSALDKACILDPSAGAGVFLVLSLRKLVAERWKANNCQPQTSEIREILNNQIRGFDINGHALKLSALSLYLTALELDPEPFPPEKLIFQPLLGKVLFNARLPGEDFPFSKPVLGSLGTGIGNEHNNKFDLVIGNPPWTPWKGPHSEVLNASVNKMITRIGLSKDQEELSQYVNNYNNANKVTDIPFLWRSMEWCKDGGIIALAMSARILFSRNRAVTHNRNAILSALRITGILNGTALRKTKIWPNISAPFCLVFAINTIPEGRDTFRFISPEIDSSINSFGRMRIDYARSKNVQFSVLKNQPSLLKTLFRGNALDAELISRLHNENTVQLKSYISEQNILSGEGFQIHGKRNPVPVEFYGKSMVTAKNAPPFSINSSNIQTLFEYDFLHRPRDPGIYKGPLLLLRSTMANDRNKGCGIYSEDDVLFNESFFGYSTNGDTKKRPIIEYLYVLTYSQLLFYHSLLVSAKFGFEREVIYKEDFDNFPIVPISKLSGQQLQEISNIAALLKKGECPWERLDVLVSEIYDLSSDDRQLISDTINNSSPFTRDIIASQRRSSEEEIDYFSKSLQALLQPFFELTEESIHVKPRIQSYASSWVTLDVFIGQDIAEEPRNQGFIEVIQALGDNEGASLIKIKVKNGHLILAMLAQYRYWTRSRARLLSIDLLRNSEEFFPLTSSFKE